MSVRILIGTIVAMALLLNGCGQSKDEKVKIAAVTCAIMAESRNMDASIRVEKLNEARDKIGGEPFLDGDDAIKEAFEHGLCQELVLNETYDQSLQYLKEAERERERIAAEKREEQQRIAAEEQKLAAEKQRIVDSKPTVKEEFWSNGKLKKRTNYQGKYFGGEKHGTEEEYYDDGQLEWKVNYTNGALDGVVERYYENGQLTAKGNYKDGEVHGLFESYHENGQLKEKSNYKDGSVNGLREEYHENGQLLRKSNYKDGEQHGIERTYKEDGKEYRFSPYCYQNGERVDMSNCE